MKKYLSFFMGIACAASVHLMTGCPVNPDDPNVQKINECAQQVEQALAAADTEAIEKLFTQDSLNHYRDDLSEIEEKMPDYADAFKNRVLEYHTELYAVYSFTEDGKTYTASFAAADNGTWQLVRF